MAFHREMLPGFFRFVSVQSINCDEPDLKTAVSDVIVSTLPNVKAPLAAGS